ncbi:MAG TPA: PE-PPE domain-containing protein [Candidatus Baltobacteraceae bacterium]|nr:PE-PPE domain-containing protein [Candidatus Baltobacteraceae bacterium]
MNVQPINVHTQYDGMADFPRYPINVLSDVNAVAGVTAQGVEFDKVHTPTGTRIDTHA